MLYKEISAGAGWRLPGVPGADESFALEWAAVCMWIRGGRATNGCVQVTLTLERADICLKLAMRGQCGRRVNETLALDRSDGWRDAAA